MEKLIKQLVAKIKSSGIDEDELYTTGTRHDEEKDVYVCQLKYKDVIFTLYSQTDDDSIVSVVSITHGSDRHVLTQVSQELAVEYIASQIKQASRPGYVDKSLSKAKEPLLRSEKADANAPTQDELDADVDELIAGLKADVEAPDADDDQCEDWDASEEYTHTLRDTFGKSKEKVESEKTPEKEYIAGDKEFVKQTPAMLRADKNLRGQPVRMDESVAGQKLIFTADTGATFVPMDEYKKHIAENTNVLVYDKKDGAILVSKQDQEKYSNPKALFQNAGIRARNQGR